MSYYEDIVMQTQMTYSRYYSVYASGRTPYQLSDRPPLPYGEQIERLVQEIRSADCVVVGSSFLWAGNPAWNDPDEYVLQDRNYEFVKSARISILG